MCCPKSRQKHVLTKNTQKSKRTTEVVTSLYVGRFEMRPFNLIRISFIKHFDNYCNCNWVELSQSNIEIYDIRFKQALLSPYFKNNLSSSNEGQLSQTYKKYDKYDKCDKQDKDKCDKYDKCDKRDKKDTCYRSSEDKNDK